MRRVRQSEGESRGKILEGSTPGNSSMCSEGALGSSSSIFKDINVFYKRGGRFYVSNEARVRRRAAFFFLTSETFTGLYFCFHHLRARTLKPLSLSFFWL